MTPQSTFMIVASVREGQLDKLRTLLASMNKSNTQVDPNNTLVPFAQYSHLHVARFVILEANTADDIKEYGLAPYPWQPALAFLGDCDGDSNIFLAQLVARSEPGLKKIFAHCDDFSSHEINLLNWFKAHSHTPNANYINWIGRTVTQVHEEAILHKKLSAYLQKIVEDIGPGNARAIRQKLLSYIEFEKYEGRLVLTPVEPSSILWTISNLWHKLSIPLFLLLLLPLFLISAPFYAWYLRKLERSDPEIVIRPERQYIETLSLQEDHTITNQFNVLGEVKPGLFRLYTMKFALFLLNYASRHIYNRGFLTRVRTIHFARWVLMDNNRRVYFASNYDGSQESYMDDFINKVGWGLNLVFSNGVSYPQTKWLIKGGAGHEQKFKQTLRRHQLPSEVWYKAYPELTAYEISRNMLIRLGVEVRQANDKQIREWLALI